MKLRLAYGKSGVSVELPDDRVDVVEPIYISGLRDESAALRAALEKPIGSESLKRIVADGLAAARATGATQLTRNQNVGIVVNDITRATPYRLILPPILEQLRGIPDEQVVIFVATGTHRANSRAELVDLLGPSIVNRFRIVQNDAQDARSHVIVGTTRAGNELRIQHEFVECAVRILTGFIEPHFFAGFSGGGKAAMPGLAHLDTIMRNHSPALLDNPGATWGTTNGNPIWEEVNEAAAIIGIDFLINVTLNRHKQLTGVFAGDPTAAHQRGCAFVRETAMVAVPHQYDVVVTTNSGHPLDLNLYQSVKGMSAAAQIVRPGGAIVIAAECWDGVPDHGSYGALLGQADSPQALLDIIKAPGFHRQDMWQAQLHAQICQRATVHIYSENLTDQQCEDAFLVPCRDIEATVSQLRRQIGPGATVCVLPEGPQTIPYVEE